MLFLNKLHLFRNNTGIYIQSDSNKTRKATYIIRNVSVPISVLIIHGLKEHHHILKGEGGKS